MDRNNRRKMAGWTYPVFKSESGSRGNSLLDAIGGKAVDIMCEDDSVILIGKNGNKVRIDKESALMVLNTVIAEDCEDAVDCDAPFGGHVL